jgi:hypothetical protein
MSISKTVYFTSCLTNFCKQWNTYLSYINTVENKEPTMGWTCSYNAGSRQLYVEFYWRGSVGKRPLGRQVMGG